MLDLGRQLVSDELLTEEFVCNLSKCRGACCVAGDAGAPLDQDEVAQMETALPAVHEYMRPEGWKIVKKQGVAIQDPFGSWLGNSTPEQRRMCFCRFRRTRFHEMFV